MSNGPEGFATGLVWEAKPTDLPTDAFVIRIERIGRIERSFGFRARVLEGPKSMIGRNYRMIPESGNSCTGWGRASGYVVVRDQVVTWPAGINGQETSFIAAIDYRPSFWNEVLRFFGGEAWQYPGNIAEDTV